MKYIIYATYIVIAIFSFIMIGKLWAATGTTYDVMNMQTIDKKMVNFIGQKVSADVPVGISNIDYTTTDDVLFTGAVLSSPSACPDDELKFQVLLGSTVLNTFIDWFVLKGLSKELDYPAKIPAGLILRVVYKNTCSSAINVKINYSLHKVLQ